MIRLTGNQVRIDLAGSFPGGWKAILRRCLTVDHGTSAGINVSRFFSLLLFIHFLVLFGRATLKR